MSVSCSFGSFTFFSPTAIYGDFLASSYTGSGGSLGIDAGKADFPGKGGIPFGKGLVSIIVFVGS